MTIDEKNINISNTPKTINGKFEGLSKKMNKIMQLFLGMILFLPFFFLTVALYVGKIGGADDEDDVI